MPVLERHPYNEVEGIPDNTHTLIVGTAPPPRFSHSEFGNDSRDTKFYYGSKSNKMWLLLRGSSESNSVEMGNSEERRIARRDFLIAHNLWMHDALQEYARRAGRETSAKDSDIEVKALADFRKLFVAKRSIKKAAFTSEQAARWTFQSLDAEEAGAGLKAKFEAQLRIRKESGQRLSSHADRIIHRFKGPILSEWIEGRTIEFFLLPTPTRMSGGMKGLDTATKRRIYLEILIPPTS